MNTSNQVSNRPAASSPSLRRRLMATGAAAVAVGLLSIAGTTQAQEGPAKPPAPHERHFERGSHGPMDPAKAAKRFDRMISRLVPDATPEQKTKLQAIAKSAFDDLRPLHEKSRAAHAESIKLLTQPTIDRAALERVRKTQQQLADQRSARVSKAFADAAEVLTPEQRATAAEKMAKHEHRKFGRGEHHERHRDGDKPVAAPTK